MDKSTLPKLEFRDDKYKAAEFMKKQNNPKRATVLSSMMSHVYKKNILFCILYDLKSLPEALFEEKNY